MYAGAILGKNPRPFSSSLALASSFANSASTNAEHSACWLVLIISHAFSTSDSYLLEAAECSISPPHCTKSMAQAATALKMISDFCMEKILASEHDGCNLQRM